MTESRFWLGFSLIPEIGPKRIALLREQFQTLGDAWHAPEAALRHAGLSDLPLRNLLKRRSELDLDAEMQRIRRVGAHIITQADDSYPELLQRIPDAPPVLYVRGALAEMDNVALAVVGTRKPGPYGQKAAHDLAKAVAGQNVTIVSGLAQGIDAEAHTGALEGGGRTIAVLGSGIDRIYPRANAELAQAIMRQGAIVSEFPLGTPPEKRNFPRRNRIISGLALGVLVVEAPEQSGALITAVHALEQGREVFAVPGSIFNLSSVGTNRLIQDGAKLVTGAEDILNELNVAYSTAQTQRIAERIQPANAEEAQLLEHLGTEPLHIDDLARLSGLPMAFVSSMLTMLELKGLAQNVGHMQYCRMT